MIKRSKVKFLEIESPQDKSSERSKTRVQRLLLSLLFVFSAEAMRNTPQKTFGLNNEKVAACSSLEMLVTDSEAKLKNSCFYHQKRSVCILKCVCHVFHDWHFKYLSMLTTCNQIPLTSRNCSIKALKPAVWQLYEHKETNFLRRVFLLQLLFRIFCEQ